MNEIRKKHIARLPIAKYPNYEITTADVAVTIPLFHSPVDSGFTDYNENRIKNIHAKGAIWVAMSLINNTDLANHGVGIYFHLEDKIYDIAKEMFTLFGVDEKFIRPMTIDDFESDNVGAAQYGKKYMFLEDSGLSPNQWLMMDSDAFVCTTGDRFQWYDCLRAFVNPSAMNVKSAVYQTDEDYRHWVQMCSHAAGYRVEEHIALVDQERRALHMLGVPEPDLILGPTDQQRTYTCTQMLVLPTAHRIIDYIKQHWKRCHWDEGMLNVYHLLHGDVSFLPDKLGGLPKHQFESEYIARDKDLDKAGYLAHLLPDNRVEMLRTDEYFDDFEHALLPSGTDGRNLQSPRGALGASSSDKEQAGAHRYGKFYDDLFDIQFLKKKRKLSVLEIGVSAYGSGSLAAWQSLECVERVVGIDVTEYRGTLNEKSTFYQLDGYARKTIDFLKEKSEPFDIIIDDGSHKTQDQAFFLTHYGELLAENGRLVCEDVADETFFRKMCQTEGVYGLDLSANRPDKKATDTHNDRILVKEVTSYRRGEVPSSALETSTKVFAAPSVRERHHVHLLSVPYSHSEMIPTCAFDQRVHRSAAMWTDLGYHVTFYGHKDVVIACHEHVAVTDDAVLEKAYQRSDYNSVPSHAVNDTAFKTFAQNAEPELRKRVKKDDLVLAFYGQGHKALCDRISDLPCHIVEPSIGYPDPFSKNRVYQSIGYMHNVRGQATYAHRLQQAFPDKFDEINITPRNVESENTPLWNDTVIPNFYNPDLYVDPEVSDNDREDWLCFIGRIHPCKGLEIIFDMVAAADIPIKVAGPGDINRLGFPVPKQVEYLGIADNELRRYLLTRAKALVVPSNYLEPFLGIHVERLFPACPLITVDFGAPMEYCLDGVTGFRCMNMDDFMYALRNLDQIDRDACHKEALRFTVKRAAISYHEYFNRILRNNSIGWHSYNPDRTRKDGLRRDMTASEIDERYAEIQQKVAQDMKIF